MSPENDGNSSSMPNAIPTPQAGRRWVKVAVSPQVFNHLHDMANQSRLRISHYLRHILAEAEAIPADQIREERAFSNSGVRVNSENSATVSHNNTEEPATT
jgi:hypothetical protein